MNSALQRFSLTGKQALVTGGSRGIGHALALGLCEAGAQVTITGRDADSLALALAALHKLDASAHAEVVDVTQRADIEHLFTQISPDIVINNAGTEQLCPSLEVDEALWQRIIDTNLKGAFFTAQAAARQMQQRGGGAIINLCSLTSEVGVPGAAPYGASKSGLLGLTRALSSEWASKNIRVNAIGPGYFSTDLTAEFYEDRQWCERMLEKIPLGRFGELDDLIGAAIFLSSDAARYITGQAIYIDGGYLASV